MPRLDWRRRTRFIMASLLAFLVIVIAISTVAHLNISTTSQPVPSAVPFGTPAPTCGTNNPSWYNRWDGCVDHR